MIIFAGSNAATIAVITINTTAAATVAFAALTALLLIASLN